MKKFTLILCAALASPLAAHAQNIAFVNGKPVPKARVDALLKQVMRGGPEGAPAANPEMEKRAREEVVMREIFMQEAERRGLAATADYKLQMELMRQNVLIRELFNDFKKKNKVTPEEIQAAYEINKNLSGGSEFRSRHILVEDEEKAKEIISKLQAGGSFEELAKTHSKDPGSAERGGELDFAPANAYVPEFSKALTELEIGKFTPTPVKTQFGYHIIQLEEKREAKIPELDDQMRAQMEQGLFQEKVQKFQMDLRNKAKTDFKFSDMEKN
jgi:peptidyl-prolyl cis-trans isomerase C